MCAHSFSFYLCACSSPHYSWTLLWWQRRVLFPFCQTYFCHFGCSQVLGLPPQGFIFQILNLRLFSRCLQNRQRLKKEERARCQAKCRRTSCDTCPRSCPPEQLGATIAEMGDHARIDVDSPLWDQTTFIGLPSKSAENDLGEKIQVGSGTLHGCRTLSADLTLQPP